MLRMNFQIPTMVKLPHNSPASFIQLLYAHGSKGHPFFSP